ncbi:efflux RND transporter periplasmic adaptor subunit [Calidifontibacillus erzurumensis]|uniref:Efflux RND transporter periplasmic adaptor subunit n=1 Tax=Calidifontibacillus erzurumensis TaxID=2741433 RepID=A0A8J8GBZ1_9BACI|nr:efflux RND transporter periplasmic adaptor subunit [Calidifontibacillus erzurumensis]NSL51004.1 efflux RND transporter periplasmic adaptor subunit [Calidifontibacillus erzurumensis]
MHKKTNISVFVLFVSLTFILFAGLTVAGCTAKETATSNKEETNAVPVQVEKARKGILDAKAGIAGKFEPYEKVAIAPKVNGKIVEISVSLGQKVNKGDVLFTLDQVDLQNAVKQAEAQLQVAQANLKKAEIGSSQGLDQAKNNLAQSESAVAQAKQAYNDAKINLERTKKLFEAGAVPSVELEQKETAFKNAEIALKNAEIAYENAKDSVHYAGQKTDIEVAKASVAQAKVNLDNAREQLANATVRAPISGIVASVNGAPGQMSSMQSSVITIVKLDPIVVKGYLSENEVTSIKTGAAVKVEVPTVGKTIDAKVTAISPVMDQQLKAYPFEIEIPNADGKWKADMVVNVIFQGTNGQLENSIIVSRKAVFEEEGKKYVYKIENNKAVKVEVKTGEETSEEIVILEGIKENDTIVVKGQTLLTDGAEVTIQKQA